MVITSTDNQTAAAATDEVDLVASKDASPADETAEPAPAETSKPEGCVAHSMPAIDMTNALPSLTVEELTALLSRLCKNGVLYKMGSCFQDRLHKRPFDSNHYDAKYFTKDAMCVAFGITSKTLAATLETAGIQCLKGLGVGVNVKCQDDVPHNSISDARPQALYLVPVVHTITTPQQFKDVHVSYYKQKHHGTDPITRKVQDPITRKVQDPTTRKVQDLTTRKVQDPTTRKARTGGKQPKKHIMLDDAEVVTGLINSGISLDYLDAAFAGASPGRLNQMFARFWEVPEVGPNLKRLSGKNMSWNKFKRIKPIYERARK